MVGIAVGVDTRHQRHRFNEREGILVFGSKVRHFSKSRVLGSKFLSLRLSEKSQDSAQPWYAEVQLIISDSMPAHLNR